MSKQSLWRVLSESTKSWDQGSVVKNNSKQALNLYIVADRDLSCYSIALSKPSAAPECGAHVNDVLEESCVRFLPWCALEQCFPYLSTCYLLEDGSCVFVPAHCLQEVDRSASAWSQLHVVDNCSRLLHLFVDWLFHPFIPILSNFRLSLGKVNFGPLIETTSYVGTFIYTWLSPFNKTVTVVKWHV